MQNLPLFPTQLRGLLHLLHASGIDPVSMSTDDSGLMIPCNLGWPLLSPYLTGLSHSSKEGTDFPHHQNKLNARPVLFPNNHTQCATTSIYNPLAVMVYCWLLHKKRLSHNSFNSPHNTPANLWPLTDPGSNQQTNATKFNFCYSAKSLAWPSDLWKNHSEAEE